MEPDTLPRTPGSLRPWLIGLALWLSLASIASLVLWHLKSVAIEGQTWELGLLSHALTGEIDRGLRGAEEGLHAMRAELREGRLSTTGDDATRSLHADADLMPAIEKALTPSS